MLVVRMKLLAIYSWIDSFLDSSLRGSSARERYPSKPLRSEHNRTVGTFLCVALIKADDLGSCPAPRPSSLAMLCILFWQSTPPTPCPFLTRVDQGIDFHKNLSKWLDQSCGRDLLVLVIKEMKSFAGERPMSLINEVSIVINTGFTYSTKIFAVFLHFMYYCFY